MLYDTSGGDCWLVSFYCFAGRAGMCDGFFGVCVVIVPLLWSVGLVFCHSFSSTGGPCLWHVGFEWDSTFGVFCV